MILKQIARKIKNIYRNIYYYNSFRKFKSFGKNIQLARRGVIVRPEEIILGSNIYIGPNFHISARNLNLGSDIMIGPNLVIESDNHEYSIVGKRMYEIREDRKISQIIIEDDVWVGANVIILPGVKISEGSIIGAGSIVTKSIPPYTIAFGNPCKPQRTRFNIAELGKHIKTINSKYSIDEILEQWRKYFKNI